MRILITGGNGFLGSHLADKLISLNHVVSLFDLQFGINTKHLKIKKNIGDIRNFEHVCRAIKNKDIIFHFAGVSRVKLGQEHPLECLETNVLGTLNILNAMKQNCNNTMLICSSSREVYGNQEKFPVNENVLKEPLSIYGYSKLLAEDLCRNFASSFGLKYLILRFSNVYGTERDSHSRVIPTFILQAMKNKPLFVHGNDQILDFAYVEDILDGVVLAMNKSMEGNIINECFNLATGVGTSVMSLAKLIVKLCNSRSQIKVINSRPFEVGKFIGDISKAQRHLGYEPKVLLQEGLMNTIKRFEKII